MLACRSCSGFALLARFLEGKDFWSLYTRPCLSVRLSVCLSLAASESPETIEVIIINLGTVTACPTYENASRINYMDIDLRSRSQRYIS